MATFGNNANYKEHCCQRHYSCKAVRYTYRNPRYFATTWRSSPDANDAVKMNRNATSIQLQAVTHCSNTAGHTTNFARATRYPPFARPTPTESPRSATFAYLNIARHFLVRRPTMPSDESINKKKKFFSRRVVSSVASCLALGVSGNKLKIPQFL